MRISDWSSDVCSSDLSCIRLRPEYPGHVWSYDFVEGRTHDGRRYRILSIIDEASRECMALPVARKLKSDDVLAALAELFVPRGPPAHIRSDNGPEFIATAVQEGRKGGGWGTRGAASVVIGGHRVLKKKN